MAKIKPIDAEDEERRERDDQPEELSSSVPLKLAFLLGIIAVGLFFGWYFQAYKTEIQEKSNKAAAKPTPLPPFVQTQPTVRIGESANGISRPEATAQPLAENTDEFISQLTNQGAALIDSSFKQASDLGEDVLGEATKQVQDTATESAKQVGDSVIKSTIGALIQQLLNQLPKDSKKELLNDLCDENTSDCN